MKENWNREKHKMRFIALATIIFIFVGLGHLLRIMYNWPLIVNNWNIPLYINWLALVVTGLMTFMGLVYLTKK